MPHRPRHHNTGDDDDVRHLMRCRYTKLYARIHAVATSGEKAVFVRRVVTDADTQAEILERWNRINNVRCEWLHEEDIVRVVQSFAKAALCYFVDSFMLETSLRRPSHNDRFLDCMSRIPLVCTIVNTQSRSLTTRSGIHWVVLACDQRVSPPEIMVFDSLSATPTDVNTGCFEECVRRYGMRADVRAFRVRAMASPKQLNQSDCGRFACAVVCALMRGVPPAEMITASGIQQRSMPVLARFMADSAMCKDIITDAKH